MESFRAEQQGNIGQVGAIGTVEQANNDGRGSRIGTVLWRLVALVLLVGLGALAVEGGIWLFTEKTSLLAVVGLMFFAYLFLISIFGAYYYFFIESPAQKKAYERQ